MGVLEPLILLMADLEKLAVHAKLEKNDANTLPAPIARISWNVSILYLLLRASAFEAAIVWMSMISGRTPRPDPNPVITWLTSKVLLALTLIGWRGI